MLDPVARRVLAPALDSVAARLDRTGVGATTVTAVGWVVGVGACVAAGLGLWGVALGLWLGNRLLDGLDGPLARRRGASDLGGFLDLLADFSVYAGFVLAVGVALPDTRLAALVLLTTYYLSGTAFLLLAPLLERRGHEGDGRSLLFVGGLAEGTETVLAYVAVCVVAMAAPEQVGVVLWVFAGVVGVTVLQRVGAAIRVLRPLRTTGDPHQAPPQETSP